MTYFDPFVLPFLIGFFIFLCILFFKYYIWLSDLNKQEWQKVLKGFFSFRLIKALKDIFLESLLHRRIFRQNFILGWMHMSFALGWFLLIIAGAAESKYYTHGAFKPPYFPIFFNFFVQDTNEINNSGFFVFIMDFLLLIILSGLVLAVFKRISKWTFGMKKTTKFDIGNKLTITCLWLIFPLRLLAESFASALYNNGGFMTGTLGNYLAKLDWNLEALNYISWWSYSSALGIFFVAMPYSRYMHIPTEVLFIFLKNFGIKSRKVFDGYSRIEVNSCPRCGLCIDTCPLNKYFDNDKIVPSYYLKSIRDKKVNEQVTFDCLMCGMCKDVCPVGIDTLAQRMLQRNLFIKSDNYLNLHNGYKINTHHKVAYFAGCMTHLTPTVKTSITKLLKIASIDFTFIDEENGACCGRPQFLAGNFMLAKSLMDYNKKQIIESDAKLLIVSCPICYKVFKEDYNLNIEILHHTEFFARLMEINKFPVKKLDKSVVYHDPCELGRGRKIYKQPRYILKNIATLKKTKYAKSKSICCGGSLGILEISEEKRNIIKQDSLKNLTDPKPDYIITACPLCKKTFCNSTDTKTMDISEVLLESINGS